MTATARVCATCKQSDKVGVLQPKPDKKPGRIIPKPATFICARCDYCDRWPSLKRRKEKP